MYNITIALNLVLKHIRSDVCPITQVIVGKQLSKFYELIGIIHCSNVWGLYDS